MVHRTSLLLSALVVGLLFYAATSLGTLRRSMLVLFPINGRRHAPTGLFGLEAPDGIQQIFDSPIRFAVVMTLAVMPPLMLVLNEFFIWHRRHTRDRLGLCLDCGHQLRAWRGRCPGCGVRIGPG
ncbi:MAG: hypothetical protein ABIP55_11265 [Tepidisphaeraceae bacterium]